MYQTTVTEIRRDVARARLIRAFSFGKLTDGSVYYLTPVTRTDQSVGYIKNTPRFNQEARCPANHASLLIKVGSAARGLAPIEMRLSRNAPREIFLFSAAESAVEDYVNQRNS